MTCSPLSVPLRETAPGSLTAAAAGSSPKELIVATFSIISSPVSISVVFLFLTPLTFSLAFIVSFIPALAKKFIRLFVVVLAGSGLNLSSAALRYKPPIASSTSFGSLSLDPIILLTAPRFFSLAKKTTTSILPSSVRGRLSSAIFSSLITLVVSESSPASSIISVAYFAV